VPHFGHSSVISPRFAEFAEFAGFSVIICHFFVNLSSESFGWRGRLILKSVEIDIPAPDLRKCMVTVMGGDHPGLRFRLRRVLARPLPACKSLLGAGECLLARGECLLAWARFMAT
jgi:hypothetical protein